MISKYFWLLPLVAAAYLMCMQDYFKEINFNFLPRSLNIINTNYHDQHESSNSNAKEINTKHKVFTLHELKKYTNLKDGLYLSILGQVFDVSKGAKHYGPGASYHVFTGRDASLAFITGEFEGKGLTDDISSLSVQQVKALNDWVQFYDKNYIYKGKLNGRYYNEDGSPTKESYNIQQKLIQAKQERAADEQKKRMFPPCNVEWNPTTGTILWCTKKSGGVDRDWIGVPRMYYESPNTKQHRCACVNLESKEYREARGAIKEYEGCPATSVRCSIKVNTT